MHHKIGGVDMQDGNADVRGIVLAGVHRWGESALERLLPRPLLPVADSPLMCYALRWLRDAGVRRTTICANSESRLVRRCLDDGAALGLDLCYYEDQSARGPAGCVRDAGMSWPARDLVVTEGNVIPTVDLQDLLNVHRSTGAAITLVVEAGAGNGARPNAPLRPAGIYVFARRTLDAVLPTGYQDIKEMLIPGLYADGQRVLTYEADSVCPRVTGIDTYLAVNEWMVQQVVADAVSLPGYRRSGRARVHEAARIADGVRLIGPVMIGPETRLAPGATIVGPTVIGQKCVVEGRALICRSVIWDGCRIGGGAIVDQCILAFGAVVAAEARSQKVLHLSGEDRPGAEQYTPGKTRHLPGAGGAPAESPGTAATERSGSPTVLPSLGEPSVGTPII